MLLPFLVIFSTPIDIDVPISDFPHQIDIQTDGRETTFTPTPITPTPTATATPICDSDNPCPTATATTTATPPPTATNTPLPYANCGYTWRFDSEDDLFIWSDDSEHVSYQQGYMRIEGGSGLGFLAYYDELVEYIDLPATINDIEVYIDVLPQSLSSISIVVVNASDYQDGYIPTSQDISFSISGHEADATLHDVGFAVGNNHELLIDTISIRVPCENVIPDTPTPTYTPTPTITATAVISEPTAIVFMPDGSHGATIYYRFTIGEIAITSAIMLLATTTLCYLIYDISRRLRASWNSK